jgi:hypothetical protein
MGYVERQTLTRKRRFSNQLKFLVCFANRLPCLGVNLEAVGFGAERRKSTIVEV